MIIRQKQHDDIAEIRALNEKAYTQIQEANVIDNLRKNWVGVLSLVAIEDEKIAGHIRFSPASIEGHHGIIQGMGLAPIAVLPELQRRGIGTQLIIEGIKSVVRHS